MTLIETLHNIHEGWHCFIIGNSPSLNELTIKQKNEIINSITIGTNSSYKIITSMYHWFVNSDPQNMTPDDVSFLESTSIPCFNIDVSWEKYRFKKSHYLPCLGGQGWSDDLTKGVYAAFTVVHPAIQFAAWIGCKKITLIGCDFTPVNDELHFERKTNELLVDDCTWNGMNNTITQCIEPLTKCGISLLNASPYYKYDTIEKIKI
jgi:hypothetical protein